MTNRNSKTHGRSQGNELRKKSKMHKRRNKEAARERSEARHTAIREALAKGN
jgi:hypothetical protein